MNDLEYIQQLILELEIKYRQEVVDGICRDYFESITNEIMRYIKFYHENLEELGIERRFSDIPDGEETETELDNNFRFRYIHEK